MPTLKAQDVLVALKLVCIESLDDDWSFTELARSLSISIGASHNAVAHLMSAALVSEGPDGSAVVQRKRLLDFLVHGVPSIFYPVKGGLVRGVPTAVWGPPLCERFAASDGDVPMVWPVANGRVHGVALEPIYKTAPKAAALDAKLYEYLTLVDAIRVGRARERKAAIEILEKQILGDKRKADKADKRDELEEVT